MWKLFKQITRCSPFDPPHYFTWRKCRRCIDQNIHMVLAHHTPNNPYFKSLTGLPDQLSDSLRYFSSQNFVTVFCSPNKMILDLKNCMTTVSLFHKYASLSFIIAAKVGGLNLDDGKLI